MGLLMKHILVIDDNRTSTAKTVDALKGLYRVSTAKSGREGIQLLKRKQVDLILLDYVMPEMDGLEVLKLLKADPILKRIPIIFLTSNKDTELEAEALENGAVDFIGKPFATKTLVGRVMRTLELEDYKTDMEKKVEEKTEEIRAIQQSIIENLASIIECRDSDSGQHVRRTSAYVELIAKELQKEETYAEILTDDYVDRLVRAAALHDIGKISVPDQILNKPGRLNREEFEIIKRHTTIGGNLIRESLRGVETEEDMDIAEQIALYHHEKWDGSGYPKQLQEEEIPLCARIMAIADVFDALISRRCYKEAYTTDEAFSIIKDSRERHFDPKITDIFLKNRAQIEKIIKRFNDLEEMGEKVV